MGRDGYQDCKLHKTRTGRPKWYCKYAVDVLVGPGKTKRMERREYFGLCSAVGKREAEKKRDEFKKKVNSQQSDGVRESQVPVSNWIRTYEASFIPTLKPNTRPQYEAYCGLIEREFGTLRLCDITTDAVQQWLNRAAPDKTRRTLEHMLAVFKSLMEVAIDYNSFEARNPCDRVRIPHGKKSSVELRALTPTEAARLLAVADMTDVLGVNLGQVVRVGLFCGPRLGEILALEWSDVRNDALYITKSKCQRDGSITEPKSNAGTRVVPLGPVQLVRPAGAEDSDRVFPLNDWNLRGPMRAAMVAAGVRMRGAAFHALRRTYATWRKQLGATSLKEAMGHSAESMSLRYVRESFDDDRQAAMQMASLVIGDGGGKRQ